MHTLLLHVGLLFVDISMNAIRRNWSHFSTFEIIYKLFLVGYPKPPELVARPGRLE